VLRDDEVMDLAGLVEVLPLEPLCCERRTRNRRAAPECLCSEYVSRGVSEVLLRKAFSESDGRGPAVAKGDQEAPRALKTASLMRPSAPTLSCSFMTSPHAGAPTRPVPTFASFLSSDPTLRGVS